MSVFAFLHVILFFSYIVKQHRNSESQISRVVCPPKTTTFILSNIQPLASYSASTKITRVITINMAMIHQPTIGKAKHRAIQKAQVIHSHSFLILFVLFIYLVHEQSPIWHNTPTTINFSFFYIIEILNHLVIKLSSWCVTILTRFYIY